MNKYSISIVIAATIHFVGNSMAFSQVPEHIAGIYSNLTYNEEGGDLLGMEIFIFPTGSGPQLKYSALVQIAEGGAPYAALVSVTVKAKTIEFVLPSGEPYGKRPLIGRFVDGVLVVRWNNGTEEKLKAGQSYWQHNYANGIAQQGAPPDANSGRR